MPQPSPSRPSQLGSASTAQASIACNSPCTSAGCVSAGHQPPHPSCSKTQRVAKTPPHPHCCKTLSSKRRLKTWETMTSLNSQICAKNMYAGVSPDTLHSARLLQPSAGKDGETDSSCVSAEQMPETAARHSQSPHLRHRRWHLHHNHRHLHLHHCQCRETPHQSATHEPLHGDQISQLPHHTERGTCMPSPPRASFMYVTRSGATRTSRWARTCQLKTPRIASKNGAAAVSTWLMESVQDIHICVLGIQGISAREICVQ